MSASETFASLFVVVLPLVQTVLLVAIWRAVRR